jgi:hypothetical protein
MLDRLQSKGVISEFVSESVLNDIKCALELFEINQRARDLQDESGPRGNCGFRFHNAMLQVMFQHSKRVEKVLNDYKVSNLLMAEYSRTVYEQIKKEMRAISPLYPFDGPATLSRSWNELIVSIYDIVNGAFARTQLVRGRKTLSIQLTAILCSPSQFFSSGTRVSPGAVGKIIKRRNNSGQKA